MGVDNFSEAFNNSFDIDTQRLLDKYMLAQQDETFKKRIIELAKERESVLRQKEEAKPEIDEFDQAVQRAAQMMK